MANYYQWTLHEELVSLVSDPESYMDVDGYTDYDDEILTMVFDSAALVLIRTIIEILSQDVKLPTSF